MFNKTIYCDCGFSQTYDTDRDIKGFNAYKYCPICSKRLCVKGYSPNF